MFCWSELHGAVDEDELMSICKLEVEVDEGEKLEDRSWSPPTAQSSVCLSPVEDDMVGYL